VLKSVEGTPVTVKQVAEVVVGPAFRRGSASMDGNGEAVTGIVLTRKGVNTKEGVEGVRQSVEEVRAGLPVGGTLHPYYDKTELVDKTIETVQDILIYSGGLGVIVLTAVLFHIPSALIVAVIIPLSLLFSFVAMKFTGLSANLMTLGAVDFGVIVDAGVVMVENIYRHLAKAWEHNKGEKFATLPVIVTAAREVGRPIVFAIFIIVAVYLPLFTLEGVEGRMFHPLALTVIYSLFGALLSSLTITPVLCYWLLKRRLVEHRNPMVEFVKSVYTPALAAAIKNPPRTIFASLGALGFSLCLLPFLGSEFIPSLDEGSILLRTK